MLYPAHRVSVESVDDALRFALDGARRAFNHEFEEMAVHLVARPYEDISSAERALITITTADRIELPMPTIRAARAVAAAIPCEAAIWIVPLQTRADGLAVFVERPGGWEQRFDAKPVAMGRGYVLRLFEERAILDPDVDDLAYVALPENIMEHARRFPDGTPYGPSAREIATARRAVRGRRAA